MKLRSAIALILAAVLASCGPASETRASSDARGSLLAEDTLLDAVVHHPTPLSHIEPYRDGSTDTAFVTCGPAERARGAAAVVAPLLGSQAVRPLALPDTGCLLWIVLATHRTLPAEILPDSLLLWQDTAFVFARYNVTHGVPSDAAVRPGLVLQAPRRVTHLRLELQTESGLRRIP